MSFTNAEAFDTLMVLENVFRTLQVLLDYTQIDSLALASHTGNKSSCSEIDQVPRHLNKSKETLRPYEPRVPFSGLSDPLSSLEWGHAILSEERVRTMGRVNEGGNIRSGLGQQQSDHPYKSSLFSCVIQFISISRTFLALAPFRGYFNYPRRREEAEEASYSVHRISIRTVLSLRPQADLSSFVAQLGNAAQINLAAYRHSL
ncbi:hypothetical protein J6590_011387 [Homalodisca vitripennis]|nr:hypothetical protein J6590_011387 [Homalodisca vitripennis]